MWYVCVILVTCGKWTERAWNGSLYPPAPQRLVQWSKQKGLWIQIDTQMLTLQDHLVKEGLWELKSTSPGTELSLTKKGIFFLFGSKVSLPTELRVHRLCQC